MVCLIKLSAAVLFIATSLSLTPIDAGAAQIGAGISGQFIGGGCVSDADCASSCCAGGAISKNGTNTNIGICSGEGSGVELRNGKTGCGFVDPNAAATIAAAKAQVALQGFRKARRARRSVDLHLE